MKIHAIGIILLLANPCFAADDNKLLTPSQSRYTGLKEALGDFNKRRIQKSKAFEIQKGGQICPKLPEQFLKKLTALKEWNGEFSTAKTIELFLKEAVNSELTINQIEKCTGGFVSGCIYRAFAGNREFYIKYLREQFILVSGGRCFGEQANLIFLQKNDKITEINNYLKIILPEVIYTYEYKGEHKACMILESAAGQSFTQIVATKDIGLINQAFKALGTALGKMHVAHRYVRSTVGSPARKKVDFKNIMVLSHGDLHGDNVFYDVKTGNVSVIDVETMANSFDEMGNPSSPIFCDLLYLLLMSAKKFGKFMPENDWEPFKNLMKTYTEVYPTEERNDICQYLADCLHQAGSIEFVDIFQHFNWKKGFDNKTVEGARDLATSVWRLKQPTQPSSDTVKERSSSISRATFKTPIDSSPEGRKKAIEAHYKELSKATSSSITGAEEPKATSSSKAISSSARVAEEPKATSSSNVASLKLKFSAPSSVEAYSKGVTRKRSASVAPTMQSKLISPAKNNSGSTKTQQSIVIPKKVSGITSALVASGKLLDRKTD